MLGVPQSCAQRLVIFDALNVYVIYAEGISRIDYAGFFGVRTP